MKKLNKTRYSLFYLAGYLIIIGFGLLFVPQNTLELLQSNTDYGDVMPRLAGLLMSGLGMTVAGMIKFETYDLYPATLFVRGYFCIGIIAFYMISNDPLFLFVLAIVALGFVLTLTSFLFDRQAIKA